MNQLIVAIAYHGGDASLVNKHLRFIQTLGGCRHHVCLLFPDANVVADQRRENRDLASQVFGYVESWAMRVPSPLKGHAAANQVFLTAAAKIKQAFRWAFLWLEPDCTFVKPVPVDVLADAYYDQPKRYMGSVVEVNPAINSEKLPDRILAGCAIYPHDAIDDLADACKSKFAWDVASANVILPRASNTELIQHFWGKPNLPPVFKLERADGEPENVVTPQFVRPDAVLFHRCKDGSLMDCLTRKALNEGKPTGIIEKRGPGRPPKVQPDKMPAPPAIDQSVEATQE